MSEGRVSSRSIIPLLAALGAVSGCGGCGSEGPQSSQRTTIKETETGFEIELDLPGVLKADLEVSIDGGVVHVLSSRKGSKQEESIDLPEEANDELGAELKDGVLLLTVGKKKMVAAGRKVEVK